MPMPRMLILEGWSSYRKDIIPAGAPEVQIEECKRAYYSGAMVLYTAIMNVLEPGATVTEADLAQMLAIRTELLRYVDEVKRKNSSSVV
jgi:hypothetical protein